MPIPFILFNAILILLFGAAGVWLGRRRKTAWIGLALAAVTVFLGIGILIRSDIAVRLLPYSNLIFLSNLHPFAVALFIPCAFAFARTRMQRVRIAVLCAVLFAFTLRGYAYHFQPLATSYEQTVDKDGVCRQSSADTCSAAALVTFFRRYGIETTEAETIQLARTRRNYGTIHLGLYRALCHKTRGRPELSPRLRKLTVDQLMERNRPAVITVGLPRDLTPQASEFGLKYNWQPGILHDVVFLGKDPDRPDHVLIGEPDYGLESWPVDALRFLHYGYAAFVEGGTPVLEAERADHFAAGNGGWHRRARTRAPLHINRIAVRTRRPLRSRSRTASWASRVRASNRARVSAGSGW